MKRKYLAAFLVLALIGCDGNQQRATNKTAYKLSQNQAQAKKAIIETVTGETIDFNKLDRQWVYINYWANWCEPCKKEIPELNAFAKSHQNVYLIGVNYDGVDNRRFLELISKNGIEYFNAITDPSESLNIGDIPGLPVTFVFNQKGELKQKLYGPQTKDSLEKAIK